MSSTRSTAAATVVGRDALILVTGATGFIGCRLVACLFAAGFTRLRCLGRRARTSSPLRKVCEAAPPSATVEVMAGNLLSPADCAAAVRDAALVFHLAAGRGQKSFADAFLNTVVTTRNLLDAISRQESVRRLVSVSSFAVYGNTGGRRSRVLDESCPIDPHPECRGDAYTFAKVRQDELVMRYAVAHGIPYVIVRPGYVYGPGNLPITGRVGVGTFGLFLHCGGGNTLPLTYVDNCADAIMLAGLVPALEGQVVNVVDDDLPTSRQFLRMYKRTVGPFPSIYLPHALSYVLCAAWESYSRWSRGQLPPIYTRALWHAAWKRTTYTNRKLKSAGWRPAVPTAEGLRRYFRACAEASR